MKMEEEKVKKPRCIELLGEIGHQLYLLTSYLNRALWEPEFANAAKRLGKESIAILRGDFYLKAKIECISEDTRDVMLHELREAEKDLVEGKFKDALAKIDSISGYFIPIAKGIARKVKEEL